MAEARGTCRQAAVSARGLGFFYEPGAWVFQNLGFEVKPGSVFAILGQNGCGKTTLMRVVLGVLKAAEGAVEKSGTAALVPQLFQAVFSFTALDMVLMGRARKIGLFSSPSAKDERMALAAMERLGVANLAARPFPELSGGQRQLVMLSRALAAEADILVMDEPASSLDLGNQAMLIKRIRELSRQDGLTVVFSTHLPQHALAAADEVLVMAGGGEFLAGPAKEVLTEENLMRIYGTVIKRVKIEHNKIETEALVSIFPDN
jgi:iron complex transport system ATP-binding protein